MEKHLILDNKNNLLSVDTAFKTIAKTEWEILKNESPDADLIIYLPSELFSFFTLDIPPKLSHKKIRQMIPFLLEDKILQDNIAFAFAYQQQNEAQITVAVLDKKIVDDVKNQVHNNGFCLKGIYPLAFCLKPNKLNDEIIEENANTWLIKTANQLIRTKKENLSTHLKNILSSIKSTRPLIIYSQNPLDFHFESENPIERQVFEVRLFLENMSSLASTANFIERHFSLEKYLPTLKTVEKISFIILLSALISLGLQKTDLYLKNQSLDEKILAINKTEMVDNVFLKTLERFSPILETYPDLHITALIWTDPIAQFIIENHNRHQMETILTLLKNDNHFFNVQFTEQSDGLFKIQLSLLK